LTSNRRILFAAIVAVAIIVVVLVTLSRTLNIIPVEPVTVQVLYSTEKEGWLGEVGPAFEATRPQINGKPVKLALKKMGSQELVQAVLDGTEKPALISPASSLQVTLLQSEWAKHSPKPIVDGKNANSCRPTLYTPLTLVMWRERSDVLWGANPGGDTWKKLHDALANPKGWEAYGKPDWGSYVRFGHTDPTQSNSGLQTLVLLAYDYFGKTNGLTASDVQTNPAFQKWLLDIERNVPTFGSSTGDYMKEMVAYGPAKYDIVAVYESVAIEQAPNATSRYGDLRVIYPPTTTMSDHPFCVVSADWVTPEQASAAKLFADYLLTKPVQQIAFGKYGYRPLDKSIPLDGSDSPFKRLSNLGFKANLPAEVDTPPADTIASLLNFWQTNAKK